MSQAKGCVKFSQFFRAAYDKATCEGYAHRFEKSSKNGDREEMVKVILDVPYVKDFEITESYRGKDDIRAAQLYNKFRETIVSNGVENTRESGACSILDEALFTASAGSRSFLDVLLDCAKRSYDLKAFARCLRYCECMLALPACFYKKTAEGANHFSQRREECVSLHRECSKKLEVGSSVQRKKSKKKGHKGSTEDSSKHDRAVTVPTVDGKPHGILVSCSEGVALRTDDKRGRHLVATRNIKAGSVLIVDRPYSFSTEDVALRRNCLHCHTTLALDEAVRIPCRQCQTVSFCSEKCRGDAWRSYHRYECTILDFFYEIQSGQQRRQTSHLSLAYRTTIAAALSCNGTEDDLTDDTDEVPFINENFLRHHTADAISGLDENKNTGGCNVDAPFSKLGVSEAYSPQDYRTVLMLKDHCANTEHPVNLIRTLEAIFLAKCCTFVLGKMDVVCTKETFLPLAVAMLRHLQAINCNAYEIVENVRDETSHVWEPRYVGGAIYPTVSLVNHSCYPNIVRHSYPSGIVVVRTLRFISKGNEILDCYGPHFLSEGKLARREYLWKKYRFLCGCEACTENWQYPLPEAISYKCRACSGAIDALVSKTDTQKVFTKQCPKCREKIDCKKLESQLRKSIEKRVNAIAKMYEGRYEDALPLLLEHMNFTEKFLATPNIETIKTQQCLIQCYNRFGCTSQ